MLGMIWNKHRDSLRLVVPDIASILEKKVTKRVILSSTQNIFDPLGLISPILIRSKLLLQKAWISRAKCDEELSEDIQRDFKD